MTREVYVLLMVFVSVLLFASGYGMAVVIGWALLTSLLVLAPFLYVLAPVLTLAGMGAVVLVSVPYLAVVPMGLVWGGMGALALVFVVLVVVGHSMSKREVK